MTTVLLVAPKYNYGRVSDGYSYEYYNFHDSLLRMGNDVVLFDFMRLLERYGREKMNEKLVELVKNEQPEMLLAVPHREELSRAALRQISESTGTTSVAWFSDDHWRFESHTQYFAPLFNWSITTAGSVLPKYAALGYSNVIKSQWACNHFVYQPVDGSSEFDVTFIGQPHGTRHASIGAIRDAGIKVRVWGRGWPEGRLSQRDMIRVFSHSRINLNLSNASPQRTTSGMVLELLWRAAGASFLEPRARALLQALVWRGERLLQPVLPRASWDPDASASGDQIKGRNFEVPGCGGFLLTGNADDLDCYYVPKQEIATFTSVQEMIELIKWYLRHDEERRTVASAGYARTLREHTYVHRFADILRRIGLKTAPLDQMIQGLVPQGTNKEIT